ncbi:MAG: protein-glutamate O-methyltransferase CheR [Bacteroidales bacterium]|nr:protein-glutamate O-methyltransferase CheR [Bacteroidales bacterium]MCF8457883.1 protein-glutamate O-methyltransferase CheR [Bacteroidales bacterium]
MIETSNIRKTDELQEADFKRLSQFIYDNYGINLYPAKRILLQSRLQKRLRILGFSTYKQYCDFVLNEKSGSDEFQELVECITTNKTEFFREIKAFDFTNEIILPEYIKSATDNQLFKVWSAGASTGKEAYSIAMMLKDFSEKNQVFNFNVSASDISIEVLKIARMAIYPMDDLIEIPVNYRQKYLLKSKDKNNLRIRIVPEIREKVKFFWLNLLSEEYKLKEKFDLIYCRNTMIYFDRATQKNIVEKFVDLLNPNAYLVLGQSESLINLDVGMKQMAPSIYKKV